MSDVSIIQVGSGQLPLARELLQMFATAFGAEGEDYRERPPGEEYLGRLLGQSHVIVLAALAGEEVVGGILAYELPKLEQARSELYIYDLAVAESWRLRGIATRLIGETRRIARERGAWMVFVQGDYGDAPALALYDKLGRREEVLHFDIIP